MPTASVNGTTIAYDEYGPSDGIGLLLSHSLFFNRSMFADLVERFSSTHRVVTYDHRGQGESAPAPLEQLDMDTLAEDAAALIEHLGLQGCHAAGNSMGGFISLRLAARRPDLVRSAVAMGSSAEEEHSLAEFAPLVAHMQEHGTAEVIDTLMHIMFGDFTLADDSREQVRKEWRASMLALGPSIGDAAHQVIHRTDIRGEIARTEVPILAIAGAEDHAYPPPLSSSQLAEAAGNGSHVTVEQVGHSVALEDPVAVADHLSRHMASVEGS